MDRYIDLHTDFGFKRLFGSEESKFQLPDRALTPAEKWIYMLRYMPEVQDIPAELAQEPFTHAFDMAEESALTTGERWQYEGSLKVARTQYAELVAAREQGLEAGREQGLEEDRAEGRAEGERQKSP